MYKFNYESYDALLSIKMMKIINYFIQLYVICYEIKQNQCSRSLQLFRVPGEHKVQSSADLIDWKNLGYQVGYKNMLAFYLILILATQMQRFLVNKMLFFPENHSKLVFRSLSAIERFSKY